MSTTHGRRARRRALIRSAPDRDNADMANDAPAVPGIVVGVQLLSEGWCG
jgi:hypothetical protein